MVGVTALGVLVTTAIVLSSLSVLLLVVLAIIDYRKEALW